MRNCIKDCSIEKVENHGTRAFLTVLFEASRLALD